MKRTVAFKMWLALCLAALTMLVVLISVACVRIVRYMRAFEHTRWPRALFSQRFMHLKDGDLLLFVATRHGFFNSVLSGDVYTHAGVVVTVDGRLHVSESTPQVGCAHTTPLLPRVKNYCGAVIHVPLSRPLDVQRLRDLREAAAQRQIYPTPAQMVCGSMLGAGYGDTAHCFQHMANLLAAANIADVRDAGYIGVCKAVTTLADGRTLGGGYKYDTPTQLAYDMDYVVN